MNNKQKDEFNLQIRKILKPTDKFPLEVGQEVLIAGYGRRKSVYEYNEDLKAEKVLGIRTKNEKGKYKIKLY